MYENSKTELVLADAPAGALEATAVLNDRPPDSSPLALGSLALPVGTQLAEFDIRSVLGEGGFGVVYLAYDQSLAREVALKEYLPASLATRAPVTQRVGPRSVQYTETFEAGLQSFINEARLLAQFDHPALVKVHRFWQGNGTAYMVMPFYSGPTLLQALKRGGTANGEAEIREWLLPLLDGLEVLHRAHCYHRDIAPDNIVLTAVGPLLLDFGAARHVIADMTQALTVVLKPGYAPLEQYADSASMRQGPWTDLYALACVVRRAITGSPPVASVERVLCDRMQPLEHDVYPAFSGPFLQAIDAALALRPQDRPQSVAEFKAMLSPQRDEPADIADIDIDVAGAGAVEVAASKMVASSRKRGAWRLAPLFVLMGATVMMASPVQTDVAIVSGNVHALKPEVRSSVAPTPQAISLKVAIDDLPLFDSAKVPSPAIEQGGSPVERALASPAKSAGKAPGGTAPRSRVASSTSIPPAPVLDVYQESDPSSAGRGSSDGQRCSELLQLMSLGQTPGDAAALLKQHCK